MGLFGFKRRAEPDGLPVATDEVSSKYYQLIKIVLGGLGTDSGPISSSNPMPIVEGSVTYAHTRPSCATSTSTEVLAANSSRKKGYVSNNTDKMFFLNFGVAAVYNQGQPLPPGTVWNVDTQQAVNAIQQSGGPLSLDVHEGT